MVFACMISSLHQVMEQLTEKCQQLQVEVKDWRKELEQLQTKHTGVLAEVEALRSKSRSFWCLKQLTIYLIIL